MKVESSQCWPAVSQGNHSLWGLIWCFAGLNTCFACQLYCVRTCNLSGVPFLLVTCFAPSLSSVSLATVSIWGDKYLHWFCQCDTAWWILLSCLGLHWILAGCPKIISYLGCPLSLRHLSQDHQLVMTKNKMTCGHKKLFLTLIGK